MNKEIYNVQVGIPSQDTWMAAFGLSLAFMLTWSMKNRLMARSKAEKVEVVSYRGSILPYLREQIVECAQERGGTHLLFLDSDQTFPKDTIRRLLGWELPVVAGNIPVKRFPSIATARQRGKTAGGTVVYSHDAHGIEQVWRVGTGVMLIDLEVFRVLTPPYFSMYWDESAKQYRGEDWVFCEKCEQAGIPIYVDHTLSKQIGHVGAHTYTHEDIPTIQEMKEKIQQQSAA